MPQRCNDLFVMLFLDQDPPVEKVLSSLQVDLLVPYSQLLLPSQVELPDTCLALGLQDSLTQWYIFSDAEELQQTRADLTGLIQVRVLEISFLLLLYVSRAVYPQKIGK